MATATTFPFLEDVEVTEGDLGPEIAEWKQAFLDEGGLIPHAACHELFGMSRQAWSFIPGKYALTEYTFFGKKWYSKREIEALHKTKRFSGGGGRVTAKLIRDCFDDARE